MKQKDPIPFTARLPIKLKLRGKKIPRRIFVRNLLAAGLLTQIPFQQVLRASSTVRPYQIKTDLLSAEQMEIVGRVQQHLFPDDGNGPDAARLNADRYLLWVLSDPRKDPGDIRYIINGIGWVDETAHEEYEKSFLELNGREQAELIDFIAGEAWGSSWLSIILTFIFEALVADPQYGGNVGEAGWDWLNHFAGIPRPTEKLLYGNILNTVKAR